MPRKAIEWVPDIPPCVRCGAKHWREWLTRLDDGWVGDGCLTDHERAVYGREPDKPKGKVHVPMEGK